MYYQFLFTSGDNKLNCSKTALKMAFSHIFFYCSCKLLLLLLLYFNININIILFFSLKTTFLILAILLLCNHYNLLVHPPSLHINIYSYVYFYHSYPLFLWIPEAPKVEVGNTTGNPRKFELRWTKPKDNGSPITSSTIYTMSTEEDRKAGEGAPGTKTVTTKYQGTRQSTL